ncbi:PREDICTED: cocaine- and amphetamine-regulated transcript protein [Haliaeetus leucocephalus]|uniref:cocaine- and amphetamine-regulated transcript protein n=1 Tax=Haliaeetus leucocephalus TaxID=52644 RepID=UPI00053CDCA7|nr:PREDICTED: cocaine- and amphetamine-regulated transcript protein [Haliaeetus leucocephalus]
MVLMNMRPPSLLEPRVEGAGGAGSRGRGGGRRPAGRGLTGAVGVSRQIEALQEVLEKLKSKRVPHYEKKFGQVPMCDAGEQCAVRKGARIGKLCDCPRGTSCNSFLLKCL